MNILGRPICKGLTFTTVAASVFAATAVVSGCSSSKDKIDRLALVERNNPHITAIDTMASFTVGNGGFAFTADITGLQTFPEVYSKGVPRHNERLGMAQLS